MELVGIELERPPNIPCLLLREAEGDRRVLPIFIGSPEATAIAFALEEVETPRPMTHDLIKDLLEELGARLERVVVSDLRDSTFYDGDALIVARTAAGFGRFGIEARHLRMYKVAAEREAGFMEQVVMPLLKQRNPTARQQAADNLGELASLGEQLRSALLRVALRDL